MKTIKTVAALLIMTMVLALAGCAPSKDKHASEIQKFAKSLKYEKFETNKDQTEEQLKNGCYGFADDAIKYPTFFNWMTNNVGPDVHHTNGVGIYLLRRDIKSGKDRASYGAFSIETKSEEESKAIIETYIKDLNYELEMHSNSYVDKLNVISDTEFSYASKYDDKDIICIYAKADEKFVYIVCYRQIGAGNELVLADYEKYLEQANIDNPLGLI